MEEMNRIFRVIDYKTHCYFEVGSFQYSYVLVKPFLGTFIMVYIRHFTLELGKIFLNQCYNNVFLPLCRK